LKSIVIYASRYGNTRRLAESIAEILHARGEVELLPADEAHGIATAGANLLVIGGPTEVHTMTQSVVHLFSSLERGTLRGIPAAAFDTRVRAARWLTGSAASGIARKLRRAGARLIADEESFFVARRANPSTSEVPELEAGELERARAWAASLADIVEANPPRVPGKTL
jgi:flavodoxin